MLSVHRDLDAVLSDLRLAVVADAARAARPPFWRRRRLLALVLVPAALGLGTGAWALSQQRGEDIAHAIGCHNEPKLESSVVGVLGADGRDPVTACAESMWPEGDAPPLVACANTQHSVVEVFPSGDPAICGKLGLRTLPDDYRDGARRTRLMMVELQSRLNRRRCFTEVEAAKIGRAVLDRHGFTDWSFQTMDFGHLYGEQRTCATGEMVWLGSNEPRTAGVTGATRRRHLPPELALEAPGCRGAAAARAAMEQAFRRTPGMTVERVEVAEGTKAGLPCSEYGVLDWDDGYAGVTITSLGPPD